MSTQESQRSRVTKDVEQACLSFIDQGINEVSMQNIVSQVDDHSLEEIREILWANAKNADWYRLMADVNVELVVKEDQPNVYYLSRARSD